MDSNSGALAVDSAALAASIGAAVLYSAKVRSPPSRLRMVVKTSSTALLSAVAAMRGGPLLLVGALALGAIGDAFLAWDDETSFLCGLGSFLVAHILYIAAFTQTDMGRETWHEILLGGTWRTFAAGALALLVPIMIFLLIPRISHALRPPVVVYSLVISVMALVALTLGSTQVVSGALMFTSSDSILAAEKFLVSPASSHRAWMQHAVWILYYSGQLLIALGLLSLGPATSYA
ncbi:Lysoplasmalogenase-like protein TMEM86A [Madurella mycetomatis]|uniref:Lysoplasmalogenase-like protein TMEM86A n=1 Tax=Madurella mycetomatis TaxID=100816 RepID=A0A175VQV9_9PEZI|nr:Lysoplasmalogenase-like protein TMEM86A [Madurella mycetomatis]